VKVLVTGASGLLGSGVALALAARGDEVTVLQRRTSGLGLREVLGDVADRDLVRAALTGQQACVHLAAKVDITGGWADYRHANIDGTRSVVDGCRANGVQRLVQVSSPSVAHTGASLVGGGAGPADPDRARGAYARSKAVSEQQALAADGAGLDVVAVRPHLVWGPGDTQLVARIIERARSGRLPILGSGAALVDSTYITNAVAALVAALDRASQAHGQALVVSNGEPRPIAELLGGICEAAGVEPPTRHLPRLLGLAGGSLVQTLWPLGSRFRHGRAGDPPLTRFLAEQLSTAHWFDQRRTRALLGWSPQVGLEAGFARLAGWYDAGCPDVATDQRWLKPAPVTRTVGVAQAPLRFRCDRHSR